MLISTNRLDLIAFDNDATDGTWNPMTDAVSSAVLMTVRFRYWVAAIDGAKVAPGLQFSKDGVDWDAPERLEDFETPTADRWNDGSTADPAVSLDRHPLSIPALVAHSFRDQIQIVATRIGGTGPATRTVDHGDRPICLLFR